MRQPERKVSEHATKIVRHGDGFPVKLVLVKPFLNCIANLHDAPPTPPPAGVPFGHELRAATMLPTCFLAINASCACASSHSGNACASSSFNESYSIKRMILFTVPGGTMVAPVSCKSLYPPPPLSFPTPCRSPGGGGGASLGQPKIFRCGSLCCCVGDCVVGHDHLHPLHSRQDRKAKPPPRGGWGTVTW